MTADAVRGAGDGDIEKGAQRMYDTMQKLERRMAQWIKIKYKTKQMNQLNQCMVKIFTI